jgi:hypothetical protein
MVWENSVGKCGRCSFICGNFLEKCPYAFCLEIEPYHHALLVNLSREIRSGFKTSDRVPVQGPQRRNGTLDGVLKPLLASLASLQLLILSLS